MKKIIFIASLMLGLTVNAKVGGDQMYQVLSCDMIANVQDMFMKVELYQGGISGIPQLQVKRFFMGRPSVFKTYLVREKPKNPYTGKNLIVYQGDNVKLTINLMALSVKDRGYLSYLDLKEGPYTSQQSFSCKFISNIQ
jgi:hypothetical protein